MTRSIIVGCGRVGAGLAASLTRAGHDVTIVDVSSDAFNRLPADFPGQAIRGDGTDEDVLRRAGAERADHFFALTEGDNRNILAAQLASETLGVRDAVAKVNDPVRAEAYTALGIATICRTTLMVEALEAYSGTRTHPSMTGVAAVRGHHDTAHARAGAGGSRGPDAGNGARPGAGMPAQGA